MPVDSLRYLCAVVCLAAGCADRSLLPGPSPPQFGALPASPAAVVPAAFTAPPAAATDRPITRLPATSAPSLQPASMTLEDALALSLSSSDIVRVTSGGIVGADTSTAYDVLVAESRTQAALAAFDTSLAAEFYSTRINQPPNAFFGPGLSQPELRDEGLFNVGLTKRWLSGGRSKVAFNPDPNYLFLPQGNGSSFNPTHVGELELSYRQPLLRGAGPAVNHAPIQIAQIKTEQSAWEFKKAVMASLRSTTAAYWELHAAQVALEAVDEVIPLLEEIVRLQEESYRAEWVIYADVAKAHAELHSFRQKRLERQSELAAAELRLRHLVGLPPADGRQVVAVSDPGTAPVVVDERYAVQVAAERHPDLVRQRLDLQIRKLELLVARNDLLPSLDFQALYRMNGVGEELGSALSQMFSAEYSDYLLGMSVDLPLGRRQSRANMRAAELQLARADGLLTQEMLGLAHRVRDNVREIDFAYQQYVQANRRVEAAQDWLSGARLRYQNPRPDSGSNWLLQSLNEYLNALRFRVEAAADAAAVLARYNTALIRFEETKGTLLMYFGIELACDPCHQAQWLPPVSSN